jgi:phenylpropionate dioxygenase-like ring-hydroxylating dioxygenase large terminal subunit
LVLLQIINALKVQMSQFLSAIIPNEKYWDYLVQTSDLLELNDFIIAEVGSISVEVQRMKPSLKDFRIVCRHRFNKIKADRNGNGPLTCSYDRWSYNQDGIPYGIPLKKVSRIR